jgi:hypothetical protein
MFFNNEDFLSDILDIILHCEHTKTNRDQTASHILYLVYEQLWYDETLKNIFTELVKKEEDVDLSYLSVDSNITFTLGTSNPYMVQII